jgi:hypothetical protein
VEAHQHEAQGPRLRERGAAFAQQFGQLVVDDLDDLLAGRDSLEDILAHALGLHALGELADDLEVHVGSQEGGTHLLEGLRDVFLREFAEATEIAERVRELVGERLEHRSGKAGRRERQIDAKNALPQVRPKRRRLLSVLFLPAA